MHREVQAQALQGRSGTLDKERLRVKDLGELVWSGVEYAAPTGIRYTLKDLAEIIARIFQELTRDIEEQCL